MICLYDDVIPVTSVSTATVTCSTVIRPLFISTSIYIMNKFIGTLKMCSFMCRVT
jgi:hypothetical protein